MKNLLKYLFLMVVGGLLYCMIEIGFRGYTHWTMAIVGGAAFVVCGLVNEVTSWETPMVIQMFVCASAITIIEFICGCILNRYLCLMIWDYSEMWGNIYGQICPLFSFIWFLISVPAIILDDYLRYWFFGEEKPRYKLL